MAVLLLADVAAGRLAKDAVAKALTAVAPLGEVHVLVAGQGGEGAAEEAARLAGVTKVLFAGDHGFCHALAEPMAALLAALAPGYSHVAAPATADAKNILPRLAALLDVMVITDVTAIHGPDIFERPIYAGNALQTVRSADPIKVLTLRTASFEPAPEGAEAPVETLGAAAEATGLSQWLEDRTAHSGRPELTSAPVVVSGGRGIGSKDGFAIVEALADKLGAAVGASRAAVDAGYAPNDWQVGQTGKVVAPNLYVALGISGAIQHLAGMKDSKVIVAINKDPEAPIFQVADFGLAADIFQAVPELTAKL
jgi:electron transfer flavoprotein alpha subunit